MFSLRRLKNDITNYIEKGAKRSVEAECGAIEPLMWSYAAARLDSKDAAQVQSHLADCSACREMLAAYCQTVTGITALREHPVPVSRTDWLTLRAHIVTTTAATSLSSTAFAGHRVRFASVLRLGGGVAVATTFLIIGFLTTWHGKDIKSAERLTAKQGQNRSPKIAASLVMPGLPDSKKMLHLEQPLNKYIFPSNYIHLNKYSLQNHRTKHMVAFSTPDASHSSEHVDQVGVDSRANRYQRRNHRRFAKHVLHKHPAMRLIATADGTKAAKWAARGVTGVVQTRGGGGKSTWRLSASIGNERIDETTPSPEFVLTTVENNRPHPTDYVMDSLDTEAQNELPQDQVQEQIEAKSNAAARTKNTPTTKEMQGW